MNRDKPRLMARKSALTLTAIILVLAASVGSTIAYLVDASGRISSLAVQSPNYVTVDPYCENEILHPPPSDGATIEVPHLRVQNLSDHNAYVRVKFNVVWKKGNETVPAQDTDYSLDTLYWKQATDGFWYYIHQVEHNYLYSSWIRLVNFEGSAYYQDGYTLKFEVTSCEGVKADPSTIVLEEFSTGVSAVDSQGILTIK